MSCLWHTYLASKSPKSIILKLPKLIHTFNLRCEKLYLQNTCGEKAKSAKSKLNLQTLFLDGYSQNISSGLLKSKPLT